jgi:lycopene beta-cyclase
MAQQTFFHDKKILVLDADAKKDNDRTWCFWEKEPDIFQCVVHHEWSSLQFSSPDFSNCIPLGGYRYKMIRGIDFYEYVRSSLSSLQQLEWRQEKVTGFSQQLDTVNVFTDHGMATGSYVFNSILFERPILQRNEYWLLQHFKGWMIETDTPVFDPSVATFMDFNTGQEAGTTFFYVMPLSPTKALVEYTVFSEKLLEKESYEKALLHYIKNALCIDSFRIVHEEFGIIPMTSHSFPLTEGRVIHAGIAGGQAKGSSGYAFRFIQKRTSAIIDSLVREGHPYPTESWADKRFHLYDATLLEVLARKAMPGDRIFSTLFSKMPIHPLLRFLDNESNLAEELAVMSSVPARIFLPAALRQLLSW